MSIKISRTLSEVFFTFGGNSINARFFISYFIPMKDIRIDLENRVNRLREEVSVIKKENVSLLNVVYDMDRVVDVLGENKVKEAIEVAKHLEQVNAKQKIKKRCIDRDCR